VVAGAGEQLADHDHVAVVDRSCCRW
jgi:hypothetical protein